MVGEARSSPVLPVGTGSGKQAGTGGWNTTVSREDGEPHSSRTPWHPALLEVLGRVGVGGMDLVCVSWSTLLFFSPFGKSTCYLCISWLFTKLIKP